MKPGPVPKKRGRPRKWKRCPECTRVLSLADDFYHWNDARHPGENRERISRVCKECTRRRARKRYRQVMADPYTAAHERELSKKRQARYRADDPAKNAARCKRYRERIKEEDPARYRAMLEDARIRSRLAKNNGESPPRCVVRSFPEPWTPALDPTPLVAFLSRLGADDAPSYDDLAATDARKVYALLNENPKRVSVVVADRLLTMYGGALSNVYPELFA